MIAFECELPATIESSIRAPPALTATAVGRARPGRILAQGLAKPVVLTTENWDVLVKGASPPPHPPFPEKILVLVPADSDPTRARVPSPPHLGRRAARASWP